MLEPSLPLWMLDTMDAPKWQQGTFGSLLVYTEASIAYEYNNNNNHDDIYSAVIMTRSLREFTRFIW